MTSFDTFNLIHYTKFPSDQENIVTEKGNTGISILYLPAILSA
jgi:hypothetical protein